MRSAWQQSGLLDVVSRGYVEEFNMNLRSVPVEVAGYVDVHLWVNDRRRRSARFRWISVARQMTYEQWIRRF